jgi:hypothetical protein
LAEVGLFCAVDLSKLDVLLFQRSRCLLVFRCKSLAVAAEERISNLVVDRWLVGRNLPPWLEEKTED